MQLFRRRLRSIGGEDEGARDFAPFRVRRGHHGRLGDGGMRGEHILDLDRIDILAARDEHLLPAAGDVGEAIGVAAGKVARAEPAVGGESRTRRLLVVPVTRSEEHTSELQSLMRNSYAVFCLKKKLINKEK